MNPRLGALALVVALFPSVVQAARSQRVGPTPQPGWDAVGPAPPPPPAGPTAVVPVPAPASAQPDESARQRGNRLLVAGGIFAGAGLVLNGLRAYIASGPCQRVPQAYESCELSWHLVSGGAWFTNIASIPLLAIGAKYRGRYDAVADASGHEIRRPVMIAAGTSLLGLGILANIGLRTAWFYDYVNPGGSSAFDFAIPGQAFAYYGGLQLSSMAMAGGIAMLVHGTARPPRAPRVARRWMMLPSGPGLQIVGRF